MNSLTKVGGVVVVLFISGIIGFVVKDCTRSSIESNRQKQIQEKMIEAVITLNKQLPVMLDEYTRMDFVTVTGKKIHYRHTLVQIQGDQLDRQLFGKTVKPILTKRVCTNEKTIPAIKEGYAYEYIYYDKNGNYIDTITVVKADCNF